MHSWLRNWIKHPCDRSHSQPSFFQPQSFPKCRNHHVNYDAWRCKNNHPKKDSKPRCKQARWCKQDSQVGTEHHIPQRLLPLGLPPPHPSSPFHRPSCQVRSWCHSCQRLLWQDLCCFFATRSFYAVSGTCLTQKIQHVVVWEIHRWNSVLDFWDARFACTIKARELRL